MAYTTHEQIRLEAGFQHRFSSVPFGATPNGTNTQFFVTTTDYAKIVPEFATGSTIAGVSDVMVTMGLSGVAGATILGVSAVDPTRGAITVAVVPPLGSSLTVTYSSSPIPSQDIHRVLQQAEATVNKRLSLCYDTPLSATSPEVTRLATQLAAAMLLIRNYGTAGRNTAQDGYELYERLLGLGQRIGNNDTGNPRVGEINLLCTPDYQIVDEDGELIPRNDDDTAAELGKEYAISGREGGQIYTISEEEFRYKNFEKDALGDQPGSAKNKGYGPSK